MKQLDFNKEYILENDMVKLRPLVSDDFKILAEFAVLEPTLWKYSLIPANGTCQYANLFGYRLNRKSK